MLQINAKVGVVPCHRGSNVLYSADMEWIGRTEDGYNDGVILLVCKYIRTFSFRGKIKYLPATI